MKHFLLDVDGVMTDGTMIYTADGKFAKVFGPDDADALAVVAARLDIHFITADARGWDYTYSRIVRDMGRRLYLVGGGNKRLEWARVAFNLEELIFMGDGMTDVPLLLAAGYGICPADGCEDARTVANYVTACKGGHRAVAEACRHVMDRFCGGFYESLPDLAGN